MHDNFMKLLQKKAAMGKANMNPMEKSAKMDMLKRIKGEAAQEMGDNVKGLKKVSVMSDSPEGLKEGLDTAEEMVEPMAEEKGQHDMASMEQDLDKQLASYSPEDIEMLIAHLMEIKEMKQKENPTQEQNSPA